MDDVLAGVGDRLRQLRQERSRTLAEMAELTGISVSTLSRLESGKRKPSLELLLPIAQAHQVPLDELVGAPPVGDPRVQFTAIRRADSTIIALSQRAGGLQAFKMIMGPDRQNPDARTHEGYEWLYVLNGKLRLVLAEHDVILKPGEAAEFDTRLPHWFGSTGEGPVEILSLFGPQGERMHVRAKPRGK